MLLKCISSDAEATIRVGSGAGLLDDQEIEKLFELLPQLRAQNAEEPTQVFIRADTENEARLLMMEFRRQYMELEEIDPSLLEWVASHLDALAHDTRRGASRALGYFHLTPARGRPRASLDRDVGIMERVEMLRRDGLPLMEACFQVADDVGIDESNVKKIYLRLRNSGLYLLEDGTAGIPF